MAMRRRRQGKNHHGRLHRAYPAPPTAGQCKAPVYTCRLTGRDDHEAAMLAAQEQRSAATRGCRCAHPSHRGHSLMSRPRPPARESLCAARTPCNRGGRGGSSSSSWQQLKRLAQSACHFISCVGQSRMMRSWYMLCGLTGTPGWWVSYCVFLSGVLWACWRVECTLCSLFQRNVGWIL